MCWGDDEQGGIDGRAASGDSSGKSDAQVDAWLRSLVV